MKRRIISFITILALFLNLCPVWALAAEPQDLDYDEIVTLKEDNNWEYPDPWEVSQIVLLNTAQYTFTGMECTAIRVTGTGVLTISGRVVSQAGAGVEVQPGGQLYIRENASITGTTYALDIAAGATVQLAPGTYSGGIAAIRVEEGASVSPKDGCAFFDENGNAVTLKDLAGATTITVSQCTAHEDKTYAHNPGTPAHTWTCAYCGTTGTEKCTFTFDENGAGACGYNCGNRLAVNVNQDDLSNLVYDGTIKPADVRVDVTLTDPDGNSAALIKDTDFAVDIQPITDAGQATVTVTGNTFNGTFVKTYTVAQDRPGLSWADSNPVAVYYDGAPVEAAVDLPRVNINIQSTVDHLEGYLQYSYRKQGDTDYISGLPKDAGTYDVRASLPEMTNFKAVDSDPITLTVNAVAPIVTAPTATAPTYNRNPQALVTAGELSPVAAADGVRIEFATEESGAWSTDIPTGTNAGDYTVWYQVTGLTGNYIAPNPNPAQVDDVKIQRKAITPVVELSDYTYLYDGGYKEPKVTVKDDDRVTVLLDTEYKVEYKDNRNVGTAKVVVSDKIENGGNYDIAQVEVEFKITLKTQDSLSIVKKPDTITYGDQFTLETTGGSDSGSVKWEITAGTDVAQVGQNSGQVTIIGDGTATVKATKSGGNNYEDAVDTWEFTADKKAVTATVTAEDKTYDGSPDATVHAVVENGVLPGDEISITGLTGAFSDANAGAGKTVTVESGGAAVSGNNSQHYDVTYSAAAVTATIRKAVAEITAEPVAASLTYNGAERELIGTGAVVDPATVRVEYALSEAGPYSTDFPKGINAGTYTVWYRIQETDNYTGLAPASVDVTIAKKQVAPAIKLSGDGLQTDTGTTPPTYFYVYDGSEKRPAVTLKEADGTPIPAGEYTVAYHNNINVSTDADPAAVTAAAKADGNYEFENGPVTETFKIQKEQARVVAAPTAAGLPLTFNTFAQKLVNAGTASGGTMVYSVDGEGGSYSADIPTGIKAKTYTVHYKVQGDGNHSDSAVGSVEVTIAPKTVKDPTIELRDGNGDPLVSYTYDGSAKEPTVVVKDGSTVIAGTEYNIVYSDNRDAGHGTVNITARPGGDYTVTGSATFVINKADIAFAPAPKAADLTYNGRAQELLVPGVTSGGTVQYALGSATSTYADAIPQATEAGTYNVYYKVVGDKNHNDLPVQGPVAVTIGRKPLTGITIELTPGSFKYDGMVHLPAVAVKDGDAVLPASEYTWTCDVSAPKEGGKYTITVSDKTGGNYDLTGVTANTADFTIGQAPQAELVIQGRREHVFYGDTFQTEGGGSGSGFQLSAGGGSGTGAVTWAVVGGNATISADGTIAITGVGEVTINVVKAGDANYQQTSAQWTFIAEPKPVTAEVTVAAKDYDGTTAVADSAITAQVKAADLVGGDTVTITGLTGTFDTAHAGTGKTVTLDAGKAQVTGDNAAKYDISYPAAVTADINRATTTIDTDPAAIAQLEYNGQPQALVTAGQTNVGFLVYSLDGVSFSREIPAGTNAGTYNVYYKVDETDDYTGVAMNAAAISVTIGPKSITPGIELSETSYRYDGSKKNPKVTLRDGATVIDPDQYTVKWANADPSVTDGLLTAVGTYTATIKNVDSGNNYEFSVTVSVEITPATQDALHITGQPGHVYYGDVITTLGTTGGTGEGTVKWSVTAGTDIAGIAEDTGKLTITGTGIVTVRAERSVPNYGTVGDNWNFTVEPKPVVAEVTVTPKTYDGTTDIADTDITARVKPADLVVDGDTVTITGLAGTFDTAHAGTGKTVTLDAGKAQVTGDDAAKYAVSYPDAARGDINPKNVTVTVTLSGHDLKPGTPLPYYEYDGTEKSPAVTATAEDGPVLAVGDYSVSYADNKNVSTNDVKAAVTVTAAAGGNYAFDPVTVKFEIRSAAAVLISSPQAKSLTYEKGTKQELVTVGAASGGTVVYKLISAPASETGFDPTTGYSTSIPTGTNAGTYMVEYKVEGDGNHADTAPGQTSVTIRAKEITPAITLDPAAYTYDGTAHEPTVTVKDGTDTIDATEYTVSYRDNVNAGTATVTVSDNNGGNYTVNGTASFTIAKAAPDVTTAPTGKTNLQYSGGVQELVNAGVTSHGTVVYSVNGGNDSTAIPTALAVGTYTIDWKVLGDANHSDTEPARLTVTIGKNTVNDPTITLSSVQFKYNGSQQKPTVTVYDGSSRVIPEHEYTVAITPNDAGNTSNLVDVGTYTVTVTTPDTSNYVISGGNTRTYTIVAADQETISITGTKAQVRYGDEIQLGVSGGTGSGTVTWTVAAKNGSTAIGTAIGDTGLLTVKDVNTPIKVTVTRSRDNYGDVSATWEFTAARKPVTAVVTADDRNYAADDRTATVTAAVPGSELVPGDSITITGLTGTFDDPNVGTDKKVTVNSSGPTVTGTNWEKYDITYPAAATASILGVPAAVETEPAANTLTYDASQAQALVTAGTAAGGTMVYSLDGVNFTPNIPKGKDAGPYTVYYKARGDQNHTDSGVGTRSVTIGRLTVTPDIELAPPSAQYDGQVHQPAVTVRDRANNVIPTSEYKVTYVTDGDKNWKDQGTYTVKVENITGGNYVVETAAAPFKIDTSAQAPLEIVNKPGLVYYGDTFTLSATGGSAAEAVTWSVDPAGSTVVEINANGLVKIIGVGPATIKATKPGGTNYEAVEATYPLNALKKTVTAAVTADDKVYDGKTDADIHVTWNGLVGNDTIDTSGLTGTFESAGAGENKRVNIGGTQPASDKYEFTIPASTTASILKAVAAAPGVTGKTLTYDRTAQALVEGGDANTLYSDTRDGVYTGTVPTGTGAGTYTVWYKAQGDANHSDSEPKSCTAVINPKTLTLTAADIELSGSDLQTDTDGTYYYRYDGTEKKPSVIAKDGAAVIPAGEYIVSYSGNKNATTADKKATVTITDNEGGNYAVSGGTTFEIRAGGAQLTGSPQARNLTYIGPGAEQELVTAGTAAGGYVKYKLSTEDSYKEDIPKAVDAGTYTVDYKVVGDDNHEDGPTGSVTVVIQPKTVVSPEITVTGTYTYDGTAKIPTVTVKDGGSPIPESEYTLSYRDNVNAGTATVTVTDNNGGNYTVNGTAAFQIGKAAAAVDTPPTGKTGLRYNGTPQELLASKGAAAGGTLVYSLSETGEYSAAIPTGKAVGRYEIWYMVQGDENHSGTDPVKLADAVEIGKNTVNNPTIQVEPASVKYTGEKQTPTITVKDDSGLVIDAGEYTAAYTDADGNSTTELRKAGTYTVTITGTADGNYTFNSTDGRNTAKFTITPADQTPLAITGTRERVYYGDTISLGTTGGNGTVTWTVSDGAPAGIGADGLLTVTGVGSVTVTATSRKEGYADQTAVWTFYADKKPVTALVTAASKTYDGTRDAAATAVLQTSDLVGGDSLTITLNGCTFEDANAGTDKKVNVDSTNPTVTGTNSDKYAISYPAAATASIFKANVDGTKVTPPAAKEDLEYTGLPQALLTAGSSPEGTMEYSLDNITYTITLTGTDAGDYEVWYRVKGDANHNDTVGTKLANKVTIAPQTVDNPTIEFNPGGATFDGQEHKPAVTVKDVNGRVIPASEYTVDYGSTNWRDEGDHTVTVAGKTGGNYNITGAQPKTFKILPAGQSPLSIVGQPGEVRYGDVFTLSTNGGSGTGAVTWEISGDTGAAYVNSQTGRVEIKKAGGPVTVTARKAAGGGYGEATATWTFSAEKRPATAIVTAKDKEYDTNTTAELVITWKDGDLLNGDAIDLAAVLTGAFDDANAGAGKRVTINGTLPDSEKYAVTISSRTTTASITPKAAALSGGTPTTLTYSGGAQELVSGVTATVGDVAYSTDGSYYTLLVPTGRDAGTYPVWYKAQASGNYTDSAAVRVNVTINPRPVTSPTVELSGSGLKQEADGTYYYEYDGAAKRPDVVVKDGSTVIPAVEYTVSYSSNTAAGTATVTVTDNTGGNYTVNGSTTFKITAGAAALKDAPKAYNLIYNGFEQELVTEGTAVNGQVVYAESKTGSYSTSIPMKADAGTYQVWYKVQGANGAADTTPKQLVVTIRQKEVTPVIRIGGRSSYSVAYNGSAQEPDITVYVESKEYSDLYYTVEYDGNDGVGTAEVTVQSMGGNYQFLAFKTFTITKGKAEFMSGGEPKAKENLAYNGTAQALVTAGYAKNNGVVLYSLDNSAYSTAIPTAINRGSYTVFAKVQGSGNYEESDPVIIPVEIGVNTLSASDLTVTLSSGNFPYTGSEVKPTVTVTDNGGNVISADEYTVTYSNNVSVGEATITIKSKTGGNYSFTATEKFQIVDANQTPLTISGTKDTVYYGDTIQLTAAGGGSGAVTWSSSNTAAAEIDADSGTVKIKSSGSVTITAAKAADGSYGASEAAWTFYARPKPVTAVVTAANKVYDGNPSAALTVTLNGLLPGDNVDTNTNGGVRAEGQFADADAGTDKTVTITALTVPPAVAEKYEIGYNNTATASITPKPVTVTAPPEKAANLIYNGGPQDLLASGGTAEGGNLMYSLDGRDYSYAIPTGTDAKAYTVWYKAEAADENHKDSAAVKLEGVRIDVNTDTPNVLCTPSAIQYDGTEKTPAVVVRDSGQRIIPESEYTVTFEPGTRIAVGTYTVKVTDKPGGNYQFSGDVTGTFEIVAASQNPLSIVTDIPTDVHYGDTFRLSAMGGSGDGAIRWTVEGNENGTPATINDNGVVTVTGTGGFTVKASREASGGYSQSNTDSVPFVANPKLVTPVVTAADKPYDGKTKADLAAAWKDGDLVNGDTITLTVSGTFVTADAGTNKRVSVIGNAAGTDSTLAKYAITWPDSTTASIYKVDAKLATAPAAADLTYKGSAQALVTAGATEGGIGKVEYSTSQNGAYSETIPTGTGAGTYTVWYKVADSVNYTGIAPASIQVEIKKADPGISTNPTASGTAGKKLGEIRLEGGAASVGGKFAWEKPETVAAAGTAYNVTFTPDDTANYNTVTIQVVAAGSAGTGGGTETGTGSETGDGTGDGTGTGSETGTGTGGDTPSTPDSALTRTTVRNGTANTVLSAAGGSRLVQQAVAAQSRNIVIQPEITGDVTKTSVSIPASTVSQINTRTDAALTVASPIADVTIPNGALDTLGSAGGAVNVVTEQVGDAVALTLTAGGKPVESVPGGVTLTVPAQDATPGTVAVLVKEDGTREVIRKSVVEDGAVSVPLDGPATVEIVDNSKDFDDVSSTDWSADAVDFVSSHELFGGTSETTFSPNQEMSRGMLATVLYRLEGLPDQDADVLFQDVDSDAWYTDGVTWAAQNGIVNGYSDGQFGPNDSITREQFAVMLWRYAGSPEAGSGQALAFTDADKVSGYAAEALRWAVANGIMSGYPNGQLNPGGTATRAQAAQMLKNFMERT